MSRTATAAKVTRSYGVTPKSRLLIKRVSPKAAHIPMAAPTSANLAPCRKTVSTLCPERQTNANFALALRHSVRNYAVDADDSQGELHCPGNTQHDEAHFHRIHLFKLCETGDVRGAYDPHALRLKRAALFRVGEVHRGREQQAILEIRKPCPARRGLVQRYQFFAFG